MTSTQTVSRPPSDSPSPGRLFLRTCAAEWTRLWSVRGTWWFLAAATVTTVGIATVAGLDAAGNPYAEGDPAWFAASFTAFPTQFALLGLVLLTVTADYTTGGIVPTLQWTPRRNLLLLARTTVTTATATAAGVLLALAATLAGYTASRSTLTLPWGEASATLGDVAFVFGAGGLLAAGLGFLLRNTAGGLVSVFLLILVLPLLLPQFGYRWLIELADVLPGTNALFLLVGEPTDRGLTDASAMVTMAAWGVGTLLLGWLRFLHQDANR